MYWLYLKQVRNDISLKVKQIILNSEKLKLKQEAQAGIIKYTILIGSMIRLQ